MCVCFFSYLYVDRWNNEARTYVKDKFPNFRPKSDFYTLLHCANMFIYKCLTNFYVKFIKKKNTTFLMVTYISHITNKRFFWGYLPISSTLFCPLFYRSGTYPGWCWCASNRAYKTTLKTNHQIWYHEWVLTICMILTTQNPHFFLSYIFGVRFLFYIGV